jgi:hypothetical protein
MTASRREYPEKPSFTRIKFRANAPQKQQSLANTAGCDSVWRPLRLFSRAAAERSNDEIIGRERVRCIELLAVKHVVRPKQKCVLKLSIRASASELRISVEHDRLAEKLVNAVRSQTKAQSAQGARYRQLLSCLRRKNPVRF